MILLPRLYNLWRCLSFRGQLWKLPKQCLLWARRQRSHVGLCIVVITAMGCAGVFQTEPEAGSSSVARDATEPYLLRSVWQAGMSPVPDLWWAGAGDRKQSCPLSLSQQGHTKAGVTPWLHGVFDLLVCLETLLHKALHFCQGRAYLFKT